MRRYLPVISLGLLVTFLVLLATPAIAGREGCPGRRVGGGTRVTSPCK